MFVNNQIGCMTNIQELERKIKSKQKSVNRENYKDKNYAFFLGANNILFRQTKKRVHPFCVYITHSHKNIPSIVNLSLCKVATVVWFVFFNATLLSMKLVDSIYPIKLLLLS